jgi:hypothetical protein
MTDVETPVLDTLVQTSANTLERSRLDPETVMLLRIAALASVGAAPASYPARPTSSASSRRRCGGHSWRSPPSWPRVAEAALAIATALGVRIPVEGLEG